MDFVYVVLSGFTNYDGPNVDVFTDRDTAEEHKRRLGHDPDGDPVVLEEGVYDKTWLDESEED